jgi:hypothetical protein
MSLLKDYKKGGTMKKILLALGILAFLFVVGCSAADVASRNLSTEADQFKITRRIVFYNGITSDYILVIEGKCSLGNYDENGEISVTCKVGEEMFKKHYLGLSDNVTYFAEQIDPVSVDTFHYKVIFKPATIVPNIELVLDN